jgi:hypothetical protein
MTVGGMSSYFAQPWSYATKTWMPDITAAWLVSTPLPVAVWIPDVLFTVAHPAAIPHP